MKYLIIGNGIAGQEAAVNIRKIDQVGEITIITNSKNYTYYRPRLIDVLADKTSIDKILTKKPEFYEENKINMIFGEKVLEIDKKSKSVKTDNDKEYHYDKLLLATGAEPFIPPVTGVDKEGIYSFRDHADTLKLKKIAKDSENIIVVGGGLLGIETANSIAAHCKNVTIVEYFDRLLPRQLDSQGAHILEKALKDKGLQFKLGTLVEKIQGDKNVESVSLKNGEELKADAVIFSAGVRPRVDLPKSIDLKINKGVIVNSKMETSEKDIYCAGDVCEYDEVLYGLWIPAKEQGKIAGINMSGDSSKYSGTPLEARLKVTGISVFSAGEFELEDCKEKKQFDEDNMTYKRFIVKDNKLIGAIVVNDNKAAIAATKVFNGRGNIEELDTFLN